ncbi:hypothetical protein V8E53_007812 [Lactarius tabidus]
MLILRTPPGALFPVQLPVSVTFSSHLCPSSLRPLRRHHCDSHQPRKIDLRTHAAHGNRQRTTADVTCPIDPCQPHAYMCHRSPTKTQSHVLHHRRAHHAHHVPPRIESRRARVTTATDGNHGIVGLSVIKVITYPRSRKKPWQTYPWPSGLKLSLMAGNWQEWSRCLLRLLAVAQLDEYPLGLLQRPDELTDPHGHFCWKGNDRMIFAYMKFQMSLLEEQHIEKCATSASLGRRVLPR